jgi:hypothetical protein
MPLLFVCFAMDGSDFDIINILAMNVTIAKNPSFPMICTDDGQQNILLNGNCICISSQQL